MEQQYEQGRVVTKGSGALCNNIMTDLKELSPCNHEEADTRLFLHVFCLKHIDNSRNFTVIFQFLGHFLKNKKNTKTFNSLNNLLIKLTFGI